MLLFMKVEYPTNLVGFSDDFKKEDVKILSSFG